MGVRKRKMAEIQVPYTPPQTEFWFYVGSKYYYRLQPIPYTYTNFYLKKVKEILGNKK
jgi:hypothetical protein